MWWLYVLRRRIPRVGRGVSGRAAGGVCALRGDGSRGAHRQYRRRPWSMSVSVAPGGVGGAYVEISEMRPGRTRFRGHVLCWGYEGSCWSCHPPVLLNTSKDVDREGLGGGRGPGGGSAGTAPGCMFWGLEGTVGISPAGRRAPGLSARSGGRGSVDDVLRGLARPSC